MARRVPRHDQRHKRKARAGCSHEDGNQPLFCSAQNKRWTKSLSLMNTQMVIMRQEHDAVACRDADDGDEADE